MRNDARVSPISMKTVQIRRLYRECRLRKVKILTGKLIMAGNWGYSNGSVRSRLDSRRSCLLLLVSHGLHHTRKHNLRKGVH